MGRKAVLGEGERKEILRLRGELDEKGRNKWTLAGIAEALGVSLTTVYRAASGTEGYRVGGGTGKTVVKVKVQSAAERARAAEVAEIRRRMEEIGLSDESVVASMELKDRLAEAGLIVN